MATVGSLLIKILADSSQLRSELEKAASSTKSLERSIESGAKKGLVAVASLTAAMVAMTVVAGQQAEAVQQLKQITGINTDALQEYDVLLSRTGLTGEDLVATMRTLSKSMEDAQRGVGTAADRFRQLGIDIRKVQGTDDLYRKIFDAVSRFRAGTERAVIVNDLMGRSALRLLPAMEGGARAFNQMAQESKNLGETMSTFQLGVLGRMDDALDDLGTAWKRFGQQMGAFVAPSIEAITRGLTTLLTVGSQVFSALDVAADTLAIRFSHVALSINEVAAVLFSKNIFSPEAWKQAADNIAMIDKNAASLIKKRRELQTQKAAEDARPAPPALVDSAKALASAQAVMDAQFKAQQGMFKDMDALNKAELANRLAVLDAAGAAGIRTAEDVAIARKDAIMGEQQAVLGSLIVQQSALLSFNQERARLFANDEKGIQDRAKFQVEANQRVTESVNQLGIAIVNADTAAVQGGAAVLAATKATRLVPLQDAVNLARADFELQQSFYARAPGMIGATNNARAAALRLLAAETALRQTEINNQIRDEGRRAQAFVALDQEAMAKRMEIARQFPTFFQRQMQDVVNSNAFSVSQIISSWTGGVANAIVTGADFVKAAWQSTQIAIIQGVLNTGVQLAAQWLLQASVELGILTATEATKLGLKTATNAAILTGEAATAGATVGIWAGATAAITGFFALFTSALSTMFASLVGVMTAVGTFVMGVLAAIAEALTATVFGIPWAGAILVGIGLIAVALAAAGAIKFAKGGVVTGPTLGLLGEAGPEAVIPLDRMGEMGGGNDRPIIVYSMLDGDLVSRSMTDRQPSALRTMGAL
jgi:hypothetical protein